MPEETAGAQTPAPERPAAETESLKSRFERLALDPYSLLGAMVYVIAAGGLALIITDGFGFADDAEDVFDFLLHDLWMIAGAAGFALGMLSIVHGIRARRAGSGLVLPSAMSERMLHPVWLFSLAPYVFLVIGLIKALYELGEGNGSFEGTMWWLLHLLFHVSAGFFLMIAHKAVSDWLHAGPASGANTASTAAASEPAADGGEAKPAGPSGRPFMDQLNSLTANADSTFLFGIYLTAYIGVLSLVFMVWWWWDSEAGDIWLELFENVAVIGGAMVFLLMARPLVGWITGAATPNGGGLRMAAGESFGRWLQRVTGNPLHMVNLAIILALVTGLPFYMVDMWSARNQEADELWSLILENSLYGLIGVGALLILRATALIALAGPLSAFGERLRAAAGGPFLSDPGQMLRALIYALALVGLLFVCVTMIELRGAPVWVVWYYFFLTFGITSVTVAMALGGRAMYAETKA